MIPAGRHERKSKQLAFVMIGVAPLLLAAFTACIGDDPGVAPSPSTDSGVQVEAGDASSQGSTLCGEYCDSVLRSCTAENRAFDNRKQCLEMCALIPPGTEGDKTNSVACRLPHAKAGAGKETCANASAYGGGVCGNRCDTFCDLVNKNCIEPLGASAPYGSKADCVEACQGMRYDPAGVEGPGQAISGEDTLNCRMFHLILSLDDRAGHCPHVAVTSTTCKTRDAGAPDGGF